MGVDLSEPGFLTAWVDQPSAHIAFLETAANRVSENRLLGVEFAALDSEFCSAAFLGVPQGIPKLERHVDAPNATTLREDETTPIPLAAHFDKSALEVQVAPLKPHQFTESKPRSNRREEKQVE
ncbi:MAG: hypothetical protein C3F12_04335 [Candidatus Methylomirabilota bacterium]|nr:hypothetical protein [candidate division NC10 bacterium]PWB47212.1 MAG: hypothetical protein C3F12_04335 [candidate division NC10 bacterium]